jgi:hypothetical protein
MTRKPHHDPLGLSARWTRSDPPIWAGAHRPCSRRRRLQMRMFWVVVSWRLVPRVAGQRDARGRNPQSGPVLLAGGTRAREPGEACPRRPAQSVDRRGWVPRPCVVAAPVLAGEGRWRDDERPGRLAARSGQVHAVGHPGGPGVSPASTCRRPAADPPPEHGGRRGPVRPRSPVLTPGDRLRPGWGTGGARCQVVSARCFS